MVEQQSDQRLWTRELKPTEDIARWIRDLVESIATEAAREQYEEQMLSAEMTAEAVCGNHERDMDDLAVRIVERLRAVTGTDQ